MSIFVENDFQWNMLSVAVMALRDKTARLLTEVFSNVERELSLQPISGERFTYGSANAQEDACLT